MYLDTITSLKKKKCLDCMHGSLNKLSEAISGSVKCGDTFTVDILCKRFFPNYLCT